MAHLQDPNEPLQSPTSILDALCCNEEHCFDQGSMDEGGEPEQGHYGRENENPNESNPDPIPLPEQRLFREDEELEYLLSKEEEEEEEEGKVGLFRRVRDDPSFVRARSEGVEWMLKVSGHHAFSAATAALAVNYLDRFFLGLFRPDNEREEKPWMAQLAAVACLSLAAKVEETDAPLLLDLQVGDARFVFEAKTIQRMEILVLSTLQWKMNPVTPIPFLGCFANGVGLKDGLISWEFNRRCERLLMILVCDSRFPCLPPSAIATATVLQVMGDFPCIAMDFGNQLPDFPKIDKEKVRECSELIQELIKGDQSQLQSNKRKLRSSAPLPPPPGSPSGVIDASFSCCDSSNDSWVSSAASSVSSSPEPLSKKSRGMPRQVDRSPCGSRHGSSSDEFLAIPPLPR